MTRYLLDTNIVSDVVKPQPSISLATWMASQADADLFISALTLAEIRRGILTMRDGRRRQRLEEWLDGPEGLNVLFAERILPFDELAGRAWAELMAEGHTTGRPRSALDTIVAAIALANGCVMVTDNERHFRGLDVINPIRPVN